MNEEKIYIIIGCTGVGKSEFAIDLAKKENGEIINADVVQMYKGLDIATNKIQNFKGIKHHLLNFLSISDLITVHDFRILAIEKIKEIQNKGKVPIIVGGTNYYIETLIWKDYLFNKVSKEKNIIEDGDVLYEKLKVIDPIMAQKHHPNNLRRIKRSIDICHQYGKKHSELIMEQNKKNLLFNKYIIYWLKADQAKLYPLLNNRVDKMVKIGLIKEIEDFYLLNGIGKKGIYQAIGYKEFELYLKNKNEINLRICLEKMKQKTRNYAKKQQSWINNHLFKRIKDIDKEKIQIIENIKIC
jgi:tRNA dimethylallyltransferase